MITAQAAVVHVVDDDPAFLKAVARLLRASGHVVATFRSAAQFLAQLTADTRGCVVADLRMPGMDGLGLQAAMGDALPMVFMTGDGDVPSAVQAMRQGAEDFLAKTAPQERVLDAVRRALERASRERLERQGAREANSRLASLTPREREVLTLVVQGMLNKQIALGLGICERTVKLHRTSITTKLGVRSAAELTTLVIGAGPGPSSFDATFPKGQ